VIFGKLIGGQIGDMAGFRYIDYIVPGLVLMSVITNSYANVVSSFYSSKFQHFVEELLIAPVPNWVILAGYVSGGVARGMTVGVVVTLIALLFSDVEIHSYGLTLAIFVLTSVLFALGGFINAVFARTFDDISIVPTFVLAPLTYLGGVFYSIDLLPEFWRQLSLFNPVLYMVNGFRYGMLGVSDISIGVAFGIILAFILALTAFSLTLLARGVGIKT
jgi:ABC-2 type transport system permease protein